MTGPTAEDKARQRKALYILLGILTALLIIGGAVYIVHQQKKISEIQELSALDKKLLEEDYNDLVLQYEGFKFTVDNDSLLNQLASEQAKVQRLMEELQTVKSTNAAKIADLRRELETLRKVLRSYVVQIDSLNRANEALRTENQAVKQQISQVTTQRQRLQAEKEKLVGQVQLAAKLSVSGLQVRGLNSRGRDTKRVQNMKQLEFTFQLDRNVTAEPGMKTIYLRITKPDGILLEQPGVSGTFPFESGQVPYSVSRQVEYGGEPVSMTIYWDIQEFLIEGSYQVEFFADGYMIGRSTFSLS